MTLLDTSFERYPSVTTSINANEIVIAIHFRNYFETLTSQSASSPSARLENDYNILNASN